MRNIALCLCLIGCAAVLVMSGCGGDSLGLVEHTGDLSATRVVYDLAARAGSAELIRAAPFIDVGSARSASALVSGWSGGEVDSESGEDFAWVISDRAVLETTLLNPDHPSLDLRCRSFGWDGAPEQRLRVSVNGREIGDAVLDSGFRDYSFALPAGTIGPGLNRVELGFSWTAAPADRLADNTDQRTLAAAFQWLSFGPRAEQLSAVAVRQDPVAADTELQIPTAAGLRYRLPVPKDAVVDVGVTRTSNAPGLRGLIWVSRPGESAATAVPVVPDEVAGDRIRFEIGSAAGEVIELGFATTGEGPDNAALIFHSPRILGSGDGEKIANVVLIVVDTLRADFLGAYGAEIDTPFIDGLAERGVRFSRARSHIPITGPSHASLFTSLLPMEHGVRNNAQRLGEDVPTLAEALRSSGRQTAAVISLGVLQHQFGFDRGFEIYGDEFPRDWLKDAAEVTDEALGIADASLSEPYFLWVHYSDPHEPYAPSDGDYPRYELRLNGRSIGEIGAGGRGFRFDLDLPAGDSVLEFVPLDEREPGRIYRVDNLLIDEESIAVEAVEGWHVIPRRMGRTTYESEFPASVRLSNSGGAPVKTGMLVSCKKLLSKPEIRDAYAGETEFVDLQIGSLLAGLEQRGLMDDTLVIFASDHGEGLGNHNHVGHISQLYDSLLHVPLIFAWKGHLPEGLVVDDAVSLVDIFPTLADLLGLDSPATTTGASLAPLLRGASMPSRPIIAVTYRPESFSEKMALIDGGFKYIRSWKDDRDWEELYDVVNDPGELADLAQSHSGDLERLRSEIQRRLAELSESSSVEAELSEEDKAQLRALGYLH